MVGKATTCGNLHEGVNVLNPCAFRGHHAARPESFKELKEISQKAFVDAVCIWKEIYCNASLDEQRVKDPQG